jgi:hypothetical protein
MMPPYKDEKPGPIVIAGAIVITLLGFLGFVLKIMDSGLGAIVGGLAIMGLIAIVVSGKSRTPKIIHIRTGTSCPLGYICDTLCVT